MLHQPSGGAGGTASDIAIMAKEIVLMRQRLNEIFARENGQQIERVSRDTERDFWMSAQQRSEEHTSELQSLMRISYAVFCLKKKKRTRITHKKKQRSK